ncbi:DNA-binding response regulator [Haloplanus salinus]|jgi:DNA-binding response OmpR family regulator|uniref:DNA-binding response regulator n=1 Tax=Haloplanus salinus TaxID=1126245 RepID=A0A368N6Y0_9EURY|nr:HalX domain-containing protein [Haloplanus salinus]RCU46272.1 DNA-binding response regulator [Haloplanus salinus]
MTPSPPHILVVEDETELAELFAEWLSEEYDVEVATDGETALELVDDDTDVVLLDRLMPGLSGDEVLETIRERGLDPRVAMVTAVEPDFDVLDMGFDDYVVKPLFRADIQRLVGGLLERDAYDRQLSELFSTASKLAALESHKEPDELADSEEYRRLEAELERARERVEQLETDMSEADFEAVFYDFDRIDL